MKYYIEVWQNKKFLFRTDEYSCISSDELIRVYIILNQKFPSNEGFEMSINAKWTKYMGIDEQRLIEAINKGKGKKYILGLKKQRERADWMGHLLHRHMQEGLL